MLCLGIAGFGELIEFGGSIYIENGQGLLGIEPESVSKALIGVDPSIYGQNVTVQNEITCETVEQQVALKLSGEMYDNYYDTMTDLIANTAGAIISVICIEFYLILKSIKFITNQ